MRVSLRMLALTMAASLLVAGCSKKDDAPAKPASLQNVQVTGDVGKAPTVKIDGEFKTDTPSHITLVKGNGKEVSQTTVARIHFAVFTGDQGAEEMSTFTGEPNYLVLDPKVTMPQFVEGMRGAKEGSRIVFGIPPQGTNEAENPQAKPGPKIMVVDVMKVLPGTADGEPTKESNPALPAVVFEGEGAPKITMPSTPPPPDTTTMLLRKGKGAAVQSGQTVTAMYHGVKWAGGEAFDSTWSNMTPRDFAVGKGTVMKAWDEKLVGATVGSRMLLVVPPKDGNGPEGIPEAGVSGTDTIVFVIDILDAR